MQTTVYKDDGDTSSKIRNAPVIRESSSSSMECFHDDNDGNDDHHSVENDNTNSNNNDDVPLIRMDDNENMNNKTCNKNRSREQKCLQKKNRNFCFLIFVALLIAVLCVAFVLTMEFKKDNPMLSKSENDDALSDVSSVHIVAVDNPSSPSKIGNRIFNHNHPYVSVDVPNELYGDVYHKEDFINEKGIVPVYWNVTRTSNNKKAAKRDHDLLDDTWGPCYKLKQGINWKKEIANSQDKNHLSYHSTMISFINISNLQNFCRPGFLIIGQGKCGTSSLYHYLVDHPRVLPATEKQIHYFKYNKNMSLKWYYQYFPKATSFLASGGLMTGEASPGYIPYPDVPYTIEKLMPDPTQRPKIIVVGRDPIDRAYSSYRYNYVAPVISKMRRGYVHGVPMAKSDDYYRENHLFTFEQMVRAELKVLRECFEKEDGIGFTGAQKTWNRSKYPHYKKEYEKRERLGQRPLVDLDGFCYGDRVSDDIIRKQWTELVTEYPERKIVNNIIHLVQAMLGRSLYLFPLEWWYTTFEKDQIYFMCTEELEDLSGEPLNELASFLGLPRYDNFSSVVQRGPYNVGGMRGYDHEVTWEDLQHQQNLTYEKKEIQVHEGDDDDDDDDGNISVPLSDEFKQELKNFFRPYNEELFKLVGRRCNWDY